MNNPLMPPALRPDLPNYPVNCQVCRVTSATVPGPNGYGSSSVLGPLVYASYTQQVDPSTLRNRDREPCLVTDPNSVGLSPGHYVCRLVASYSGLPLYEAVGAVPGRSNAAVTTTLVNFVMPLLPRQLSGSSSSAPGGNVVVLLTDTSALVPGETVEISDGSHIVYGTVTTVINSTSILLQPIDYFAGSPGQTVTAGAYVTLCCPIFPGMPVQNPANLVQTFNQLYVDNLNNLSIMPLSETFTTQVFLVPALNKPVNVPVQSTGWMVTGMQVAVQTGGTYLYGWVTVTSPTAFTLTLTGITGGGPGGPVGLGTKVVPVTTPLSVPTTATFVVPALGTGVTVSVPSTTGSLPAVVNSGTVNLQTALVFDGTVVLFGYIKVLSSTSYTFTPTAVLAGAVGNTVAAPATIMPYGTTTNPLLGLPSLATGATTGFPNLPAMAGVPTGSPNPLYTGYVPLVVDTADGAVYGYYGGAWHSLGGGSAAVSSVTNTDGTLVVSPTTGAVVASLNVVTGDLLSQTSDAPSVVNTVVPSDHVQHQYMVGGYANITSISVDVLQLQCDYIDETGNAQTVTFFPIGLTSADLSSTGAYAFPTVVIRVLNSTGIKIYTTLTVNIGSITYDVGGFIQQLN